MLSPIAELILALNNLTLIPATSDAILFGGNQCAAGPLP